jgi:hypothetical protein
MRLSVVLLLLSLAGILGGAALIGLPALGGAVVFDSLVTGAYALLRDDGRRDAPPAHEVTTLASILERARAS